jgi:ATP synthase protein I
LYRSEQTPVSKRVRAMAYAFVGVQAAAMLLTALAYLFMGVVSAQSALLGGVAIVLPSGYFAYRLFRITSARAAHKIVKAFYVGEVTKILLSAVLAVIFIRFLPVDLIPFLVGFLAALVGFWIAPAIVKMDVSKGNKT